MKDAQHIQVSREDDGQRLDRWLKKMMPFVLAQKLVRTGQVRVNGKRVKPDVRLEAGQDVRIPPYDAKPPKKERPITDKDHEFIKSIVLYDDGDVVVLNKPYGVASQGGSGVKEHVDRLFPALENKTTKLMPKLIHRLDKETSGILLCAREPETIRGLGKLFKHREVKKLYWAVVTPAPETYSGTINAPIGRGPNKETMGIDEEEGKPAVTEFSILEKASKKAAFMAFWPKTGRTHQIRVHAADVLECPIFGDERYQGEMDIGGIEVAKRLHLHARRLVLSIPGKKKTLDVVAPLPPELVKSWQAFGFDKDNQDDPFIEEK